ncbi:hypothetical protein ACSQ67_020906 [Phaseolus vulgaris]
MQDSHSHGTGRQSQNTNGQDVNDMLGLSTVTRFKDYYTNSNRKHLHSDTAIQLVPRSQRSSWEDYPPSRETGMRKRAIETQYENDYLVQVRLKCLRRASDHEFEVSRRRRMLKEGSVVKELC